MPQKPMDSDIDIEADEPTFNPLHWIRAGKQYPSAAKLPRYIANAYRETFHVPQDIHPQLFQKTARTVPSFVSTSLAPHTPAPSFIKPERWFSSEPPNANGVALLHRLVPHIRTLEELKSISGQMWFDGCRSIQDPRYPGQDWFPLHALQIWSMFVQKSTTQCQW